MTQLMKPSNNRCTVCNKKTAFVCGMCGYPVCLTHGNKFNFRIYHSECLEKAKANLPVYFVSQELGEIQSFMDRLSFKGGFLGLIVFWLIILLAILKGVM